MAVGFVMKWVEVEGRGDLEGERGIFFFQEEERMFLACQESSAVWVFVWEITKLDIVVMNGRPPSLPKKLPAGVSLDLSFLIYKMGGITFALRGPLGMICDDVGWSLTKPGWVMGHNAETSWALGSPLGAFRKRPPFSLLTSCSHCCFGKVSATQVKTLVRLGCSCRVEGGIDSTLR